MARWFVDRLPQRGIPSGEPAAVAPGGPVRRVRGLEVSGCTDDHRRLDPGQVFVAAREARPGHDGHLVREALERGRPAWLLEHPCPEAGRLQVIVPDADGGPRGICQALAGDPSRQMTTIGIAGSSAKTVTALMFQINH